MHRSHSHPEKADPGRKGVVSDSCNKLRYFPEIKFIFFFTNLAEIWGYSLKLVSDQVILSTPLLAGEFHLKSLLHFVYALATLFNFSLKAVKSTGLVNRPSAPDFIAWV